MVALGNIKQKNQFILLYYLWHVGCYSFKKLLKLWSIFIIDANLIINYCWINIDMDHFKEKPLDLSFKDVHYTVTVKD